MARIPTHIPRPHPITPSNQLTPTTTHPFHVENQGWTPAGQLHEGDQLRPAEGTDEVVTVVSLQATGHKETVYNFTVTDWHNYHIHTQDDTTPTPILVHNDGCGTQVDYGSTPLSQRVQQARLAAGDRRHNYAAAILEDGTELIGVSAVRRHAEQHIIQQVDARRISELYTEHEPCEWKCAKLLKEACTSNIT